MASDNSSSLVVNSCTLVLLSLISVSKFSLRVLKVIEESSPSGIQKSEKALTTPLSSTAKPISPFSLVI
jgi:hypothetical protein